MIFTLEEMSQRLDSIWMAWGQPPAPLDVRLTPIALAPGVMQHFEQALQVSLPEDFRYLLSHYDFDRLSLGGVTFASESYIDDLVQVNSLLADPMDQRLFQWWGEGPRPGSLIQIGHFDSYCVLLDCASGQVRFFNVEDELPLDHHFLARNSDCFVRCAGTVSIARSQLGNFTVPIAEVIQESGAPPDCVFWLDLAGFPADGVVRPIRLQ